MQKRFSRFSRRSLVGVIVWRMPRLSGAEDVDTLPARSVAVAVTAWLPVLSVVTVIE